MWTWSPSVSGARRSASSESFGVSPNFEPWWPVRIDSCVSASMPGVTRISVRSHTGRAGAVDLLERVHDDERSGLGGRRELLVRLVVPVEDEPAAGEAGGLREAKLAERRDVGADPLLGEDPHHREIRERFRPVDDRRLGRGLAVGTGTGAQRRLVVDEERAPVLADEVRGGDAAEREASILEPGRVREEPEHSSILPVDELCPVWLSFGTRASRAPG